MSNRVFRERLNNELNVWNLPEQMNKRAEALSDITKIKPPKALDFINGIVHGNDPDIQVLANELDVDVNWLLGKSDKKHGKPHQEEE